VTLALCLSHLAGPGGLSAAPIRQEQVVKVVETWVRHETADVRADAVVERIDPYRENGVTLAYAVHLENGGYCLAGADSLVLPVYFYCPKGVYDPKDPNSAAILREIAGRQRFLQQDEVAGARSRKRARPNCRAAPGNGRIWPRENGPPTATRSRLVVRCHAVAPRGQPPWFCR
jgi:hypothetical protein